MAASDEKLVELCNKRWAWANEFRRSYYEDRWIRNWQWYRNVKRTKSVRGQPWQSNAQIPDAFRIVETMVPQHVLNMFRTNRWFSVSAPSVAGETYQEMVRSLLLQGWRKADAYKKTIVGVKMGTILGHVLPKVTWRVEIGEREITDIVHERTASGELIPRGFTRKTVPEVRHNGPAIEFPDLFNLWLDPTGKEQWAIERIPTSFEDLRVTNGQFGGSLYKNLDKLKSRVAFRKATGGGGPSTGGAETPPLAHTVEGIVEQRSEDSVELWQCWGYVPPSVKRYDDTQWRLLIVAERDLLIRDVPAPTHDHRPPYVSVPAIPIPGQLYGDSVLSYIGDLIDLRSQIENMRRDETLLNIYGTYVVDGRFQIRGQSMFKAPGGAMKVTPTEPGLDVSRAVVPMPRHPVLPEAYQESSIKERQMLDISGATEPFQGTAFGGRTTATEVNLIANLGTSRFALQTMWLDESFKRPILERFFKLYQTRLTEPEVVQLVGEPSVQDQVTFQDLQFDVDISVDSGLFGSLDQAQLQNMVQVYQMLLQNPATAEYIDIGKFTKAISFRAGLEGADDFVRSANEVAAIAQQREAAEKERVMLASIFGGGDNQGAPQQ